jgi:hypothetical protein
VSATIFLEGAASGPDSKEQRIRCREGFHKLLEKCGFNNRMPRLKACGSRDAAFNDFKTAVAAKSPDNFVALWIDSEDPLQDLEASWSHLKRRDPSWKRPAGAEDEQVLFMTTCMETLIVADRDTLKLESRHRHEIQEKLTHATRNCTNAYAKGQPSFKILGELSPAALEPHLPSFVRIQRILDKRLPRRETR